MKPAMREAFERVQVTKENSGSPLVKRVLRVANRQDTQEAARRAARRTARKQRADQQGAVQ